MKLKSFLLPSVALACLGYALATMAQSQPKVVTSDPVNPPAESSFRFTVAGVGLVEPCSELISLAAPLPGVVEKVFVKAGDQVKAGQALVLLDTRSLVALKAERTAHLAARQAEIAASKAKLQTAGATCDQARSAVAFVEKLAASKAVSAEDIDQRRRSLAVAEAQGAEAQAGVALAEAGLEEAAAALQSVAADLARSTISAPVDAQVLQVRIRAGEYAAAGPNEPAWLVLGDTRQLHIRTDIDEHEAWRVHPTARAEAQARGTSKLKSALTFVRFEPLIIPKKSLTGDSAERVDTRVLQVIYAIANPMTGVFPGQQMDVAVECAE